MRTSKFAPLALVLMLTIAPVAMPNNSPLTESAKALISHAPQYPEPAIARGLEGLVMLTVDIAESGQPSNITVSNGNAHPILRAAALKSVKQWEFSPATHNGKAVRSTLEIPIRFELLAEHSYGSSVMNAPPFRGR